MGPADSRSRSSNPARSCNISGARPACSIRPTSGHASRSTSGCSGRSDYARERIAYAIDRYTDEVSRLYRVMDRRLANRAFLAGDYSIADMACVGWVGGWHKQGQDIAAFPNLKRWLETLRARPAVRRGKAVLKEAGQAVDVRDPQVQAVLFDQRTR